MKFTKNFTLFFFILSLALSCSGKITPLESLTQKEPTLRSKPRYNSYLALEYLRYARKLTLADDAKSAKYFAKKGEEASLDANVIPENPLIWKADQSQMTAMVLMQKRLENVLLASRVKIDLPIQAAHLTYLYDCWVSHESQAVFHADKLAPCRVGFTRLLEELEVYIDESKKDKTEKVKITEPEFERFEIIFDFNISKVNDRGVKDLVKFLKHITSLSGNYKILLVGNADRSGSRLYNKGLAMKRAETVENYLIKNGIHKEFIEKRSVGEDFPDLLTKDRLVHQRNRSVVIYVLKGYGSFLDHPLPLIENIIYKREIKKARQDRGLEGIH